MLLAAIHDQSSLAGTAVRSRTPLAMYVLPCSERHLVVRDSLWRHDNSITRRHSLTFSSNRPTATPS